METARLVESYGAKISLIARRMIRNEEIALEAAQEVWYQIMKSLESFKGSSSISTWIYTIARRTIMHYAREEQSYSAAQFDEHFSKADLQYGGPDPERLTWTKMKCDDCLTAFCHCLDNRARLIFIFHEVVRLSYGEIANIMEIGEENARKIASRSREKVKSFMERDCLLFSTSPSCRCRIKKEITDLNLAAEYRKAARTADLADFYKQFDGNFPDRNYWEELIKG